VVPPDVDMLGNIVPSADRSFKQLFDLCKTQVSCSRAFPELEKQFYQAAEDLNKKPVSVTVLVQKNRQLRVMVDGDRLVEYLFDELYRASNIPKLPQNIYLASNGHLNEIATWIAGVVSGVETYSEGAYYSVDCHDRLPLTSFDKLQDAAKGHPAQLIM